MMPTVTTPTTPTGLFGLQNSNHDFTEKESWGKNQFNNAFPAALACYMFSKGIKPVYIKLNAELKTFHDQIGVDELFGFDPLSPQIYYAFETEYEPYLPIVRTQLPRVDLVTLKKEGDRVVSLRPIEIKLTALPDDLTSGLVEAKWGSEIVVRPDTIVYLALSLSSIFRSRALKSELLSFLDPFFNKNNRRVKWHSSIEVAPLIPDIARAINNALQPHVNEQKPLLMQPIWKTEGKSSALRDNCLDTFVWSDMAFTRLFIDRVREEPSSKVTRPTRAVVWLGAMLHEYAKFGKMNHQHIIDTMTYNTKNDKAFSIGGIKTSPYMACPELVSPRITRSDIPNIITGQGNKFLSPERRFDAAIQALPDLF